jgi:hypothetical protein
MAMVDRYKKSGGFLQLVQVIETCNAKKREQFMTIITEESPNWAEALNQKCISFEKILSWNSEVLLEVLGTVNNLAFSTALKSLSPEGLNQFFQKLSHQERKKLESTMAESNSNSNEISSSVMKVISETRSMLVQGSLKADKIDHNLVIPDDFENLLEKGDYAKQAALPLSFESPAGFGVNLGSSASPAEIDKLQKKLILLSKEVQSLKQENQVMKDKLEKIKKIA